jgi:hypothetical protein
LVARDLFSNVKITLSVKEVNMKNDIGNFWLRVTLVVLVVIALSGSSVSAKECVHVAGTWNVTEVSDETNCGGGSAETESNIYTITQNGCSIEVTDEGRRTYTGTVSGSTITWSGSFPEEGGTTTIQQMTLTVSGDNISGSCFWTWTDGIESCSGTTQISGTRDVSSDGEGGNLVTSDLWIKAVINTEEKGPIEAVWQKGGEDTTFRGDRVIWGHFYASPADVTWGSSNNPDLFVKIWFDVSGRVDVNFFHVSVPNIEVYSDYPHNGTPDKHGTTTMDRRYIRQYYENGQSHMDENYEDGVAAAGYSQTGNPSGYSTINNLRIGSLINTVEKGPIEAVWRLGGQDTTARGDQVVWGHYYANPSDVTWGSQDNPDLFVKIWFDVSGRVDVNFFHVSVPDIEVYSDLPTDATYDQRGTTIMADRYIRHEYQR